MNRPDNDWVLQQLGVSATGGDTGLPIDDVLPAYARMGYSFFEAWFTYRGSALEPARGAGYYRKLAERYGIQFGSVHLSPVQSVCDETVRCIEREMRFAHELGIGPATVTARTVDDYSKLVRAILPLTDDTDVCPVIQFHEDGAFRGIEDMKDLYSEIQSPRLQYQLEVGSLHAAGIDVLSVLDLFAPRLGLVHLKDMVGKQSVPIGTGEIDVREILARLRSAHYRGPIVVEIANTDVENTRRYFADAIEYLRDIATDLQNGQR